jgi:diguanylate cyclase (GGDEF)-like protein
MNQDPQGLKAWQRPFLRLLQLQRGPTMVLCTVVTLLIAAVDITTPPQLNLAFAYSMVILLATWNIGLSAGIVFAAIAFGLQVHELAYFRPTDGMVFWYVLMLNRAFTFGVVAALTAALRRMFDIVQERTLRDSLTNAYNASHFIELLNSEIARSGRSGAPFTLAYLDCDDFKLVNTLYGHLKGDAVLRTVVETARRNVRGIDAVARLGGDEFAIIFPQTDKLNAVRVLSRLQESMRAALRDLGVETTVSIGALTVLSSPVNANDVLTAGDELMYRAKRQGKDRVVHETLGGRGPRAVGADY